MHLLLSGDGVRVLGYGFGVRGRKVKPRDCALASDIVCTPRAPSHDFKSIRFECRGSGNVRQDIVRATAPTWGPQALLLKGKLVG